MLEVNELIESSYDHFLHGFCLQFKINIMFKEVYRFYKNNISGCSAYTLFFSVLRVCLGALSVFPISIVLSFELAVVLNKHSG